VIERTLYGFLTVFLGGGLGSAARHGINLLSIQFTGLRYPVGTFLINVLGSLLIGVLVELFALRMQLPANLRLFLVTGILGGFTTFSTFSLEIGLLHQRGQTGVAILYATASVVCGVVALFAGMYLTRQLLSH
jgi:fluoride exporter